MKSHKNIIYLAIISLIACNNSNQNTNKPTTSVTVSKMAIENLPCKPRIEEKEPSEEEKKVYQIAYDLWYNDKPKEGIENFKKFIQKYPQSSLADDAQRMIATAYENMENYQKSIEEFKKVKTNYPDANSTPSSLYDMAHLYFFSLNDFVKSRYYYEEFINSATIEDKKFRDIALEQIKNWDKKTEEFAGSAQRWKEYKKDKQASNPTEYLKITAQSWEKGGFETVGIHSLAIQNTSDIPYKDIVVRIDYYSETGTFLGRNLRTIYKLIPAKQTIKINELNTGFISRDAKKSSIEIITAIANN